MTNAQRQAVYRKRHLQDVDGQGEHLNMVVPIHAKAQLMRLAAHYGVTQREPLARVLVEAESIVLEGLSPASEKACFAVTA
jgi:hypothetical protein